ncbi:MAG: hypothetical protein ACI9WU_001641 [Myxococcota bacterium]|jgi:hypothetical protein
MSDNMYFDQRLQETALRDSKMARDVWEKHLTDLPDRTDNLVQYDEEGNPANLPKRTLKTLPVKPGEPEPKVAPGMVPRDPLADAWDEMPTKA